MTWQQLDFEIALTTYKTTVGAAFGAHSPFVSLLGKRYHVYPFCTTKFSPNQAERKRIGMPLRPASASFK